MDAIITPPIKSLLEILKRDFNVYTFTQNKTFMWSPEKTTIFHPLPLNLSDIWSLLHEIAHAQLNHTNYTLDIELVSYEAQAWRYAEQTLAPHYNLLIDTDYIEDHLDTYRQWLHTRSLCPRCGQNGFQATQNTYNCNNCRCLWRVNEARMCRLRRIKLPVRNHPGS